MRRLELDDGFELMILLGDMHASAEFGRTADEAVRNFPGATIELIDMGAGRGDSPLIRLENLAVCLAEAARILDRHRPDVVVVHGDRGEHLMVAFAAVNLGIAVAHTQGGDRSGNVDELQRHAITKLAHVHFPESKASAERIVLMGEDPWRVHDVGSTYVDRIVAGEYIATADGRSRLGLEADEDYLLVVVHPETFLDGDENRRQAEAVLDAARRTRLRSIVTYPCSDPGYEGILQALDARAADPSFIVRPNIDNDVYLGLLAGARLLLGNSSAALVEAPYLRLPAVNVGERQRGRDRDANVIDSPAEPSALDRAIARASEPAFRAALARGSRLGDGRASERIMDVLRNLVLDERLFRKQIAY